VIDGITIESEMVTMSSLAKQFYETPYKYTCVIRGNSTGYTSDLNPPVLHDRTLAGIRQETNDQSGIRVRCEIDLLLRPAQRAYVNGSPFIVSYINYYVLQGDSYMDAGERA
jgi:hypothetical protein